MIVRQASAAAMYFPIMTEFKAKIQHNLLFNGDMAIFAGIEKKK